MFWTLQVIFIFLILRQELKKTTWAYVTGIQDNLCLVSYRTKMQVFRCVSGFLACIFLTSNKVFLLPLQPLSFTYCLTERKIQGLIFWMRSTQRKPVMTCAHPVMWSSIWDIVVQSAISLQILCKPFAKGHVTYSNQFQVMIWKLLPRKHLYVSWETKLLSPEVRIKEYWLNQTKGSLEMNR